MTKLRNIVVRISDVHNEDSLEEEPALMLSCHYDSTFPSLGGVDDGQAVVSLLEIARVVTNQDSPLVKPLVIMFNNGEEDELDGGRAFKDHPWHDTISRFINLESTGANNMPIMFRLGPGSLAHELYESSPFYVHANVLGEDLINLLPSDTDFTAYYLEQNVPGFDYAYYMNGYSYHTENDNNERMNTGSMQYLGDHTLGQVEYYCRSSKSPLGTEPSSQRYVYFDFLTMALISYPEIVAKIVVPCIIFIGFLVPIGMWIIDFILQQSYYKLLSKYDSQEETPRIFLKKHSLPTSKLHVFRGVVVYFFFIFVYALTLLAAVAVCVGFSFLMNHVNPLSWYGNPGLGIAFYGCVALAIAFFILGITNFLLVVAFRAIRRRRLFRSYMDFDSINVRFMNRFTRERYFAMYTLFSLISLATLAFPYPDSIRAAYVLYIPTCVFILATIPVMVLEGILLVIYVMFVVTKDVKRNFESDSTTELTTFDEGSRKSYRDLYQSYNTGTTHDSEDDDFVHEQVLASYSKLLNEKWYVRLYRYLFIKHRPMYFIATLIATLFLIFYLDLMTKLLPMIMPMLGRTGSRIANPDLVLGVVMAFSVLFIFYFAAPQFGNVGNFSKIASLFTLLSFAFGLTLLLIFPYNANHPKRVQTKNIFRTTTTVSFNLDSHMTTSEKVLNEAQVSVQAVDQNYLHQDHALFNGLTYKYSCTDAHECFIIMDEDIDSDVIQTHSLTQLSIAHTGNTSNLYNLVFTFTYPQHYSTVFEFDGTNAIKSLDTLSDPQEKAIFKEFPSFYKLNVANNQTIFNVAVNVEDTAQIQGKILFTECEMDAVPFTRDFFSNKDWALVNGQGFCDYTKSEVDFVINFTK
eukprot:CAMPEP_0117420656 /NCGR_PEP_ID=MMETSP0758-20121206/1942_1 /TAXON_ID=63605 /ORGANISM="Percolomonas cosmopolitus, Strain AE-1 (ATCC 50343)" /LENGTH=858 /DNA_ID=CAMNT_0005202387 /DNA_START=389 /DNA_END=2965 /DNA_ORIENTATION=+